MSEMGRARIIQGSFGRGFDARQGGQLARTTASAGRLPSIFLGHDAGVPLPTPIQTRLEEHFGESLSDVRVHTDDRAASIGAEAFTAGSDIHFGRGHYQPFTSGGLRLIAHEVAHVIQQRHGRVPLEEGSGIQIVEDVALEAEADRHAAAVVDGSRILATRSPAQPATTARGVQSTGSTGRNWFGASAAVQRSSEEEQLNAELTAITESLAAARSSVSIQTDPRTLAELDSYLETAQKVLAGSNVDDKKLLIASCKSGEGAAHQRQNASVVAGGLQMKATRAVAVQRNLLALGGALALVGYGIYRILQNRAQVAQGPLVGVVDIPVTRAGFGLRLRLGGLTTGELTDQEIGEEVRRITAHNHNEILLALTAAGPLANVVNLVVGVRNNNALCVGPVCHELTRYLVQHTRGVPRPTEFDLKQRTPLNVHAYNMTVPGSLEAIVAGLPAGTSCVLGNVGSVGHSFTVVDPNFGGHAIVADRHPANGTASLKYADAVQSESRLALSTHPAQAAAILNDFSGSVVTN